MTTVLSLIPGNCHTIQLECLKKSWSWDKKFMKSKLREVKVGPSDRSQMYNLDLRSVIEFFASFM
jgi:hypothetical protein